MKIYVEEIDEEIRRYWESLASDRLSQSDYWSDYLEKRILLESVIRARGLSLRLIKLLLKDLKGRTN